LTPEVTYTQTPERFPLPVITIIIPCFNSETKIIQCLESVYAQTIQDIETVIVNDASTDKTLSQIQNFLDSHLDFSAKIISHSENQGVSASRNDGIKVAAGDYITFVDADDVLVPDFCQRLYSFAHENELDIAACNAIKIDNNGQYIGILYKKLPTMINITINDYLTRLEIQPYFDTCWSKLWRHDFLDKNELVFQEGIHFGEDTLFTNSALLKTNKIGILGNYCGYRYAVGNSQSCCAKITVRNRLCNLQHLLECLRQLHSPERMLLRKSREYIWTIKKFNWKDRKQFLATMVESTLWTELLFPVILHHDTLKHRIIAYFLNHKYAWAIFFW
jgi:glycosyltransferase involved in cell wall biosynthesis